ncbi:MAG: hypothetical protein R3C05_17305 [Pirellulaceae bacterium]
MKTMWPNVVAGFQLGVEKTLGGVPDFPTPQSPRGIAIVGGGKYLVSVYVSVRVLRHVGCDLPIEVWHFDGENDPQIEAAIRAYGVTFRNATTLLKTHPFRFIQEHWWRGWQLKSYALLHSSFENVLLLDADNYPTRDPEYLFDWPDYREHGAVIWPDQVKSPTIMHDAVRHLFEIDPPTDRMAESGQLLMNRRRCWRQLVLAGFYNQAADLTYRYIWGDKDTFPFAFHRTNARYARMWPECQIVPDCLLQYDFNGRVIFQHRVGDKFRLEGSVFASTPQISDENRYNASLAHEAFCFSVLDELRSSVVAENASIATSATVTPATSDSTISKPLSSASVRIEAYILTCPSRASELQTTLDSLEQSDWPDAPTIVCDQAYPADSDLRVSQTLNALDLIKLAALRDADCILFFEDDVNFNRHLHHNLMNWGPIKHRFLFMGSLYNPGIKPFADSSDARFHEENYFIADHRHVYGSQAFVLSRSLVRQCADRWHCFEGMQDIRISTIAGLFSRTLHVHAPSLVQHRESVSTWEGTRHVAYDFDPGFKASC